MKKVFVKILVNCEVASRSKLLLLLMLFIFWRFQNIERESLCGADRVNFS